MSQDLEGAAKVTPFFQKAGFKALQPWLDPDVGLSTHYGVNLPTTVLYDAQGREVWRVAGRYGLGRRDREGMAGRSGVKLTELRGTRFILSTWPLL